MAPTSLATVLRTHADSMESEGWYTIANRMVEAAKALEYAEILRASVLSNIGHIEKAAEHPCAGSELQIEMACSKLRDAAMAFERRNKILANVPDDHTGDVAQPTGMQPIADDLRAAAKAYRKGIYRDVSPDHLADTFDRIASSIEAAQHSTQEK